MKLTHKFSAIIAISACILIGVISYISSSYVKTAIEQSLLSQQLQLAKQTVDKIDRFLYERTNNIATIAGDHTVEEFLTTSTNKDETTINKNISIRIQQLSIQTGPWDNIEIIDKEGVTKYAITGALNETIGAQHEALFKKALAGDVVYSDALLDKQTNKIIMLFAAPVRNSADPNRSTVGIVMAHLSWPVIPELLQSIHGPVVKLYTKNGLIIATNAISQTQLEQNENIHETLTGNEGSIITRHGDPAEEYVTSFATQRGFITYKGNDWKLVIEQPARVAFTPAIDSAIRITLILIPIILVISSLLLFLIIRSLKPIEKLTETAREIATGDLSKRVTITSNDEVGQLGLAFNNMANKLQDLYKGLEEKVEEKTAALMKALQESEKINSLTLGREMKLMEYKRELMRLTGKQELPHETDKVNVSNSQMTKTAMLNLMEDLQLEKLKLDQQNQVLDLMVKNMPIGVAINDKTGKVTLINEAGLDLLGRGMDPNLKLDETPEIFKVCKPDGSPYPVEELTNSITMKQSIPSTKDDIVIHHPDNRKVMIRATSAPIKDAQGNVTSVVSIFEDITKEKEVDRMKTEFISLASHQLRTPLSAIRWFSEMLAEGDAGKLTPEQKEFVQNISDSTQRMIELVNSLLNISRIESGRILIDPKPTNLKELVEGIVKELKVKIDEKRQTLIVSVHQELPFINVDPKLIRQVYMNLLTNAIKYTPSGGEISVFISKKDDQVVSQVTDNGYGIPKLQQNKLFQKFFRAENIIKIETDGTGLGLYLIKSIIESSHGKIWFESEENKGTTFWFSLPMSGMEPKKGEVTLDS